MAKLLLLLLLATVCSGALVDVDSKKDETHVEINEPADPVDGIMTNVVNVQSSGCCGGKDNSGTKTTQPPADTTPPTPDSTPTITTTPKPVSPYKDEPWIMMLGGSDGNLYNTTQRYNDVHIVSLIPNEHPVPSCIRTLKNYPIGIAGALGNAFDNGSKPLVCGGSSTTKACYAYDIATDTWSFRGNMTKGRYVAGKSIHPTLGMVMTGGTDSPNSSVEATTDGTTMTQLPALPFFSFLHCQVYINQTHIMVAGGQAVQGFSHFFNKSAMLDLTTNSWTILDDMPTDHNFGPGCGLVRNKTDGKQYVVVAGGFDDNVDIYDLEEQMWKRGNPYPFGFSGARSDPLGDSFVIGTPPIPEKPYPAAYLYETETDTWRELNVNLSDRYRDMRTYFSINKEAFDRSCAV